MNTLQDRAARQRDLVPPERLALCRATVVGVGAIGRQVALQLAAMGVPSLQLIDPDTVEAVNLGCQGYLEEDLGRQKVAATADLCQRIYPQIQVQAEPGRFRRRQAVGNVLFCAVDDILVRRLIWQATRERLQFFVDGRMSAQVLRILAVAGEEGRAHYPSTLFDPTEAYQGACTARSTIFTANIAAGLMLGQFSKHLRGLPVEKDMTLNLLGAELSVG